MKLFGRKWFGEIAIGAGSEKALAILSHGVRGEGDDRDVPSCAGLRAANLRRCFHAVHIRHLHIHENEVKCIYRERVQCLSAGDDVCDVVASLFQKHGCEQSVYRVVLGQ